MPSASNHNKLVKQTSVGSVNSGGGGSGTGGNNNDSNTNLNAAAANISETNIKGNAAAVSGGTNIVNAAAAAASGANVPNEANNPMKQALTTIEHKIRNLEKRKTKLQTYRDLQTAGKELSADQKTAVAKFDAVAATLEFARDFTKQMVHFSKEGEKEQKKQARKDIVIRAQTETAKIREVLIIQNIIQCFSNEMIRNDFLNGESGANKLEINDVDAIMKCAKDIDIKRPETVDDSAFLNNVQKAAEVLSMTVDARPKPYGETTFENLHKIFSDIQESGYLDKIYMVPIDETNVEINENNNVSNDINVELSDIENVNADDGKFVENLSQQQNDTQELAHLSSDVGDDSGGVSLSSQQQTLDGQKQLSSTHHQQQLKDAGLDSIQYQQQELQQQQITANLQHQSTGVQTVAAGSGIGNFNQPHPASGTTTPVHVSAIYQAAQQQLPQAQITATAQQLPQIPGGGNILNVQQQQQQQGATTQIVGQQQQPQQRQMVNNPQSGQLPLHGGPPQPAGHFPPTTVRAVEQSFFKQHQQHQFLQQMRPLADVIGTGSFYFLQDSELDSPELPPPAGGVAVASTNTAVANAVYEQQSQTQSQHNQHSQTNLLNSNELQANKKTDPQQQQQLAIQQHHSQQTQQSSAIATQTFTNQAFPPLQQVQQQQQQQQQQQSIGGNSNNTAALSNSSTPSPLFQQKHHQQLFSPVAVVQQQQQQQALHQQQQQQQQQQDNTAAVSGNNNNLSGQQQQQQQQMMMTEQQQQPIILMNRLSTPQTRIASQQQQQQQQQQSTHTTSQQQQQQQQQNLDNAGFPFENPVVTGLTYEQQLTANTSGLSDDKKIIDEYNSEPINEWDNLKNRSSASNTSSTNVLATAALTNALKPNVIETNKWSTEMNALSAQSSTPNNTPNQSRGKNEWSMGSVGNSSTNSAGSGGGGGSGSGGGGTSAGSGGGGGGYGDGTNQTNNNMQESNHWNSNQQDGNGGYARGGSRGPGGGRHSGGSGYRDRDDRREDRGSGSGGRHSGGNGGSGGYRSRPNNYGGSGSGSGSGNATQQQNGNNGRGNGNNNSIYFRNNDNSATGSYYQNGGNVYANKDAGGGSRYDSSGGNYRGPRNTNNSGGGGGGGGSGGGGRNNAQPQRSLGRSSGGGGSVGANGGGNTNNGGSSSSAYINNRPSNRMSMGMENKN